MGEKIQKEDLLFIFEKFGHVYKHKFLKDLDERAISAWTKDWSCALRDIERSDVFAALEKWVQEQAWPPCIAEFRKYCDQASGVPSYEQAMRDAVNRNFHHPLIKLCYNMVGSHHMTHDSEPVLRRKFFEAYNFYIDKKRSNPNMSFEDMFPKAITNNAPNPSNSDNTDVSVEKTMNHTSSESKATSDRYRGRETIGDLLKSLNLTRKAK